MGRTRFIRRSATAPGADPVIIEAIEYTPPPEFMAHALRNSTGFFYLDRAESETIKSVTLLLHFL